MPHGFRKLPRLLFLLLLAGSVLFFLAPASLRTFGPPPGLSYFKGSLPQGWKLDGQVPEDALLAEPSGDRKQPVVLDLDRFRPQKQTPGKITTSTQVAAIPALTKAARNSCPDPFRSAPLPLTKRQLDLDGCEEVATLSQDFKVSVCPALASAGVNCNNFFVVIERNDLDACEEAYKEPISMYKDNAAEIKRTTGPDTFQLFITGTERWATSQHIGYSAISAPCRYIYPVTLSNAGTFNLQIHHLWDLWHGDADFMAPKPGGKDYYTNKQKNNKGHIPLTPRKIQNALFAETDGIPSSLLPSSILCPPSCKQYAFNANPDNSVTGSLRTLSGAITRYNAQPLCSRVDAIQGAYFPDPTPVQNTSLPIVQYRWHPLGCKLSPKNSLMLDGKNGIAARKQCLGEKQRTIVFDGDSHTRISYDALMPRLRGDGEGKPVYGKAKTKENTFEKATFHFTWDSHFIHMMDDVEPPHEADVVVLSIGSHQARNRWTTRTFRSMLDRHVKYFKGWSYTPRMLYITAPAKQPYNGDWRTHPRIASWSKLEVEVARKAGFDEMGFIRGFDTTLPFTRESPDGIHFRDLPAQEGWLLQMMHKMNLCDEE